MLIENLLSEDWKVFSKIIDTSIYTCKFYAMRLTNWRFSLSQQANERRIDKS
jgi:hypothetical protein